MQKPKLLILCVLVLLCAMVARAEAMSYTVEGLYEGRQQFIYLNFTWNDNNKDLILEKNEIVFVSGQWGPDQNMGIVAQSMGIVYNAGAQLDTQTYQFVGIDGISPAITFKLSDGVKNRAYIYLGPEINGVTATWTVTPSSVPIPGAVWLFGSGLVGLVGLHRKLRRKP